MNKKIGVIMSAYNENSDWIRESVESILNQTYSNLRLYIVLDNPNNQELRELLEYYESIDDRVELIKNKNNLGLVACLNLMINIVREDIIARMDADDISDLHRFEKEMKYLDENNLDFVMTGANTIDEIGNVSVGDKIPNLVAKDIKNIAKYGISSIHSSWLLKKEVYISLNGYRNIKYCEDLDFLLRAIQAGYKIGRLKENLQLYRIRSTSLSQTYSLEQYEKAKYLKQAFSKNIAINFLDVDCINNKFGNYSKQEINNFMKSKNEIEEFSKLLYSKKIIQCLFNIIKNILSDRLYRKLFVNYFISRSKTIMYYRKIGE